MRPRKIRFRRGAARLPFVLHLCTRHRLRMPGMEQLVRRSLQVLARPGTQYRLALVLSALLSLVCGWTLFVWMLSHSASLALVQGLW